MLEVGPAAVDRALRPEKLVEILRRAFREGAVQPLRHHHTIEHGRGAPTTLLLMPAWTKPGGANAYAGVKIVTVSPDNGHKNLPAVMGTYLLLDAETGAPLAAIDGPRLTLWRTAAASALAASYLARRDASKLLVVGAGALAPFLARAHAKTRPIREVRVWNRTPERAARVAAELGAQEGLDARAAADLDEAVAWADIVSSATISSTPLVKGALLKPGSHLDLVGAFTPDMRESDDEAVRRARVFVDIRESALKEAGDIVQALLSGALTPEGIEADLYDLTREKHPGRRSDDEITLFKSVGAAIEDLAAGIAIYEHLAGGR
ncbi:MAG TPA: ornithine cyclodeaminase family protein [Mesorhizobium sp.]|jgi:ornithine cyclodeaminase|nr:ornithine cyclodeaminase family protein [Mesorhizobium sp.]